MLLKYRAGNVAQYVVALGIDRLEEIIEDVAHDDSRLHHIVIVAQRQQLLSETHIKPKGSFSFVQWHLLLIAQLVLNNTFFDTETCGHHKLCLLNLVDN